MGKNQDQDTHVQRSSGMSFVMLWRREAHRLVIIATLLTLFVISLLYALIQGTAVKYVTVVLNGQETFIETRESKLQNFLDEHDISVSEYDRISKSLNQSIQSGDIITIDHVTPVKLTVDGETKTLYTAGETVQEAIQDLNISIGADDRIIPAGETKLAEAGEIEIVRVQAVVDEQEHIIPFEVVTQQDHTLAKGKERVVQEGKEGIVRTKVKKIFENGKFISEEVIDEETLFESFNQIVAVGTKNPVTILSASSPDLQEVSKNGVSFGVKRVLDNVTLTAYDAGFNSTGKTESHPQFGMTYTGTIVEEGRTVAVDPDVIPLGWWIYIEGIGLRKAEDIGSAIKGKKVDVYMESEDQANIFGRQHGHTVYIVGPKKPALN
jgi:uncharacterized protein YabE (DUF348 family)/3D (Asp-Asp-Asp) domain-containing protein